VTLKLGVNRLETGPFRRKRGAEVCSPTIESDDPLAQSAHNLNDPLAQSAHNLIAMMFTTTKFTGLVLLLSLCCSTAANPLRKEDTAFLQRMMAGEMNSLDTVAPTPAPTAPPVSSQPSAAPSSVPSYSGPQAIVKIEFDAVFTLEGLTLFDVPIDEELLEFQASIANSIQEVLTPLTSSVKVEVTTVGGLDVDRRLRALQESPPPSIEVGIQVVATKACYRPDCEDDAVTDAILAGYKDALAKSVDTGDLTGRIRAEASSRGISPLDQSTAVPQSSRVIGSSVEILEPDGGNIDEDTDGITDDEGNDVVSSSMCAHLHAAAVSFTLLLSFLAL
jgi:hypothetical protein